MSSSLPVLNSGEDSLTQSQELEEAGIDFVHVNDASGQLRIFVTMPPHTIRINDIAKYILERGAYTVCSLLFQLCKRYQFPPPPRIA